MARADLMLRLVHSGMRGDQATFRKVLGKERGDLHETGEIKRVVSSLLMQIDNLPTHVMVIGTTNHAELLDRAVWRRFQVRMTLAEAEEFGSTVFRQYVLEQPDADMKHIVSKTLEQWAARSVTVPQQDGPEGHDG
jgi:AAA+ superfamily predicted ATPase